LILYPRGFHKLLFYLSCNLNSIPLIIILKKHCIMKLWVSNWIIIIHCRLEWLTSSYWHNQMVDRLLPLSLTSIMVEQTIDRFDQLIQTITKLIIPHINWSTKLFGNPNRSTGLYNSWDGSSIFSFIFFPIHAIPNSFSCLLTSFYHKKIHLIIRSLNIISITFSYVKYINFP
jgi:hypothetical protein